TAFRYSPLEPGAPAGATEIDRVLRHESAIAVEDNGHQRALRRPPSRCIPLPVSIEVRRSLPCRAPGRSTNWALAKRGAYRCLGGTHTLNCRRLASFRRGCKRTAIFSR